MAGTPRSSYSSLSPLSSLSSFPVSAGCASERACWNEGFAGITIDCSLCSCSSVSLSLSLSLRIPCSCPCGGICSCARTYTCHPRVRARHACTDNISIETRRFSILQVCNRLCGTMEPAVEQFLHCARPDEREEKGGRQRRGKSPSETCRGEKRDARTLARVFQHVQKSIRPSRGIRKEREKRKKGGENGRGILLTPRAHFS